MAQQISIRTFELQITDPYQRFSLVEALGVDVVGLRGFQLFSRQRRDLVYDGATISLALAGKEVYPEGTGAHLFTCGGGVAPGEKFWLFLDRDGREQHLDVGSSRQLVFSYANAAAGTAPATAAAVAAALAVPTPAVVAVLVAADAAAQGALAAASVGLVEVLADTAAQAALNAGRGANPPLSAVAMRALMTAARDAHDNAQAAINNLPQAFPAAQAGAALAAARTLVANAQRTSAAAPLPFSPYSVEISLSVVLR
jgi:hypothetical protein